jgi:hypothetical protein
MKKRALVVGINEYRDVHGITALSGAEQDAQSVGVFLQDRCEFQVDYLLGSAVRAFPLSEILRKLTANLDVKDLFVFYFAGHGHEDASGQLLLCHEAQVGRHSDHVSIASIEQDTASPGLPRLLILDTCRTALERSSRTTVARGNALSENVSRWQQASENPSYDHGPLIIVHSCSPTQRAYEDVTAGGGYFTRALLAAMTQAHEQGTAIDLPDVIPGRAAVAALARSNGLTIDQTPWIARINCERITLYGKPSVQAPSTRAEINSSPFPESGMPSAGRPARRQRRHNPNRAQVLELLEQAERAALDVCNTAIVAYLLEKALQLDPRNKAIKRKLVLNRSLEEVAKQLAVSVPAPSSGFPNYSFLYPYGVDESKLSKGAKELHHSDESEWARTTELNTADAYKEYVRRNPKGQHVRNAKFMIQHLRSIELFRS